MCAEAGVSPRIAYELEDRSAAQAFVAAGISMVVPHPLRLTSSKSPAELGRMAAEAQAG